MSGYGYWGRERTHEAGDFHERAFRRTGLAEWDEKWHGLSPQARSAFVDTMKGPARNQADHAPTYLVASSKFPQGVLEELIAAGFAKVLPARTKTGADRVFAPAVLYDFAARIRMLNRLHLLRGDRPDQLETYAEQAYFVHDLLTVMDKVLRTAGMDDSGSLGVTLRSYVMNHRWPAWVSRVLKDPTADQVVRAIQQAGGPIPVAELPGRVAGVAPDKVQAAVDKLIARLVLFEDLDPGTSDIVVDFLPAVRDGLDRAGRPRVRPPMVVCERPGEVGPDDSPIVGDLRAFLLEVAAEPPRLRQDRHLFQKEVDRFQAGLEPLPDWLMKLLRWTDEGRLGQAMAWARTLRLVEEVAEGSQDRLRLSSQGQRWLASGLDAQYAAIYAIVNAVPKRGGPYTSSWRLFSTGPDSYYSGYLNDTRFLGEEIMVVRGEKERKYMPDYWEAKPDDIRALRTALDQALSALQPGVFYRLDSVAAHLAYGEHNPLNVGLAAEKVTVIHNHRRLPSLEERREEVGRTLIRSFICHRLIPLGCVRTAVDAKGEACVERLPRLDAYFGRKVDASELAPAPDAAAKVVVQPDFSVIVIGLNPTATAELAPFCERAARGGSRGAVILKITRESVVRAVANGLAPSAIVDRLRRHASHEVPANVLHEVRAWSGWVRKVTAATLAVLRCPDSDTADRVIGALKKQAERLNDTLVAVDGKLTAAERGKLKAQGIIVEGYGEAPTTRPKSPKKRRGW